MLRRSQALLVTSVPVTGTMPRAMCSPQLPGESHSPSGHWGWAHNGPLCAGGRRGEALTSAREEFLNAIQASLARLANCVLCNSCSWAPRLL